MLNKIMMSCRLLSEPAVTTKDDPKYCKFSIAVEQPKQKGVEDVESDTFTCLAFDDNASAVSFLYSKGGTITFVVHSGTLPITPLFSSWRNCTFRISLLLRWTLIRSKFSDSAGGMLSGERKWLTAAVRYSIRSDIYKYETRLSE